MGEVGGGGSGGYGIGREYRGMLTEISHLEKRCICPCKKMSLVRGNYLSCSFLV